MSDDRYSIDSGSPTSNKLLRIFLAASIIDNNGELGISRKALAELSDFCQTHRSFQIVAHPNEDHDMELSIEWEK